MHQVPPGLPNDIQVAEDGISLLGIAVRYATFIHTTLHRSVAESEEFLEQLDQLRAGRWGDLESRTPKRSAT